MPGVAELGITFIINAARTGQIGDGGIFVTNLAEAIRIRTGKSGVEAF